MSLFTVAVAHLWGGQEGGSLWGLFQTAGPMGVSLPLYSLALLWDPRHSLGRPASPTLARTAACCTHLLASGAQTVGQVQQTADLGVWMPAFQAAWALC